MRIRNIAAYDAYYLLGNDYKLNIDSIKHIIAKTKKETNKKKEG